MRMRDRLNAMIILLQYHYNAPATRMLYQPSTNTMPLSCHCNTNAVPTQYRPNASAKPNQHKSNASAQSDRKQTVGPPSLGGLARAARALGAPLALWLTRAHMHTPLSLLPLKPSHTFSTLLLFGCRVPPPPCFFLFLGAVLTLSLG